MRISIYPFWITANLSLVGGECPHLRWKTDITVQTEDNVPVDDAIVTAVYPDGRTDEAVVSAGKTTMYLPGGTNILTCEKDVYLDRCEVQIDKAPTNATLTLEDDRDLFIICDYYQQYHDEDARFEAQPINTYQEILSKLKEKYPEAQIMTKDEWTADGTPEIQSAVFDIKDNNAKGLSRGDVVVNLDIFSPRNVKYCCVDSQYHRVVMQGPTYYSLTVGIVLGVPQRDGEDLHLIQTFLLGYSHDTESETLGLTVYPFNNIANYIADEYVQVYENILASPFLDEQYRYLEAERTVNAHFVHFPITKMLSKDYFENYAQSAVKVNELAIDTLIPYIDAVWKNEK